MPSFRSIALFGLAALGAVNAQGLTDAEAQQIATNYGDLIATYSDALADASLAPNFTDYSESVNTLINSCPQGSAAITLPLLAPTFSNLTQFKIGQGQQPQINFKQLNIWHSADTVIIRWITTNTAPIPDPKPVVGIISMHVIPAPSGSQYPYLIDTVYSEFDAGAWLQNLVDAGICSTDAGLPTAGNATSTTPAASTCSAATVTIVPAGCTAAPTAPVYPTGTGASVPPYQTGSTNGTHTYGAPTGSASNPPAYTGPAYTGAASSMKASYGISALFLGLLVFLN